MNECQLISLRDAAAALGIHLQTAYKLVKLGEFPLPIVKIGSQRKINQEQLDHFIRTGVAPEQ